VAKRDSLLEQFFQEFYDRLMEVYKEFGDGQATDCIHKIQHNLIELLHDQVRRVSMDDDRFAENYCHKTHYALVAFTDEFFLKLDWPRRNEWLGCLFEERVFKTHNAGTAIFDDIEHIVSTKSNTDTARIYLKILGLGFTGKYTNDPAYISKAKARLFATIYHTSPTLDIKEIFTNANALVTIDPEMEQKTRDNTMAWYAFACCMVYLFASHAVWRYYTLPVWGVLRS
jgi:type IV/VI secretion system ImpK/VasF family protein